jgi:hypothetical protein
MPLLRRRVGGRRRGRRLLVFAALVGAALAYRNKKFTQNEQTIRQG